MTHRACFGSEYLCFGKYFLTPLQPRSRLSMVLLRFFSVAVMACVCIPGFGSACLDSTVCNKGRILVSAAAFPASLLYASSIIRQCITALFVQDVSSRVIQRASYKERKQEKQFEPSTILILETPAVPWRPSYNRFGDLARVRISFQAQRLCRYPEEVRRKNLRCTALRDKRTNCPEPSEQ